MRKLLYISLSLQELVAFERDDEVDAIVLLLLRLESELMEAGDESIELVAFSALLLLGKASELLDAEFEPSNAFLLFDLKRFRCFLSELVGVLRC